MDRVQAYKKRAAACVLLAEEAGHPVIKAKLLALAREWTKLAELVERNASGDPFAVAPPHRRPSHQPRK